MVGPNPDSFERALKRFKASLNNPKLQQQFSACSLQDVYCTIREIQDEQFKQDKQRHMQRLQAFVEAMEQFSKVIEVFLNAHEIVCFVWGPIKYLLTITRTYFDVLDKLLDAYSRIGGAIPGLLHYKTVFETHHSLATVLEDYYSDVLNFHCEAVKVFNRPRWKVVFGSAWKTFETNFSPILQSLARRRELLESTKSTASLYEIQKAREEIRTMYDEQRIQARVLESERHRRTLGEIKVKLQSPNYQLYQEQHTEDRNGNKSGEWIFIDPEFQSWYNSHLPGSKVLYINGIPGAGKTTLMSTVINKLLKEKRSPDGQSSVAYFFFKDGKPRAHNSFLRAFLEQLISQNAALSNELFDELSTIESENLRNTGKLQELIARGMFLYARVVLNNLLNQATLFDLKNEIHPDTFPRGIEDARVIARVLSESYPESRRENTRKLLGLVIGAQRPLKWREVQAFFCIDQREGKANYEERRLRKSSKELCGSLVDAHRVAGETSISEEIIQIVHPTAQRYLIERGTIEMSHEQTELSLFCSQYLVSKPFMAGACHETIMSHAVTGSYALLDYAVQHWYDHAKFCIDSLGRLEPSLLHDVVESLEGFLNSYGHQVPKSKHHHTKNYAEVINSFEDLAKNGRERNSCLRIELRTTLIRKQVENLYNEYPHPRQGVIIDLYGPKLRLKCPKPWCSLFTGSFQTAEERDRHVRRHERSFYCPVEGCHMSNIGLESASALEKHQATHHPKATDKIQFPTQRLNKPKDLRAAAKSGKVDVVKYILDSEEMSDPSTALLGSSLFCAAEKGHANVCELLLSRRVDVNYIQRGKTPLEVAAQFGHLDVVNLLLVHSSIRSRSGFLAACTNGQYETARLIFENVGCEEAWKAAAINYSVQSGNLALTSYLIEKGFGDYVKEDLETTRILERQDGSEILELLLATGRPILEASDVRSVIRTGFIEEAEMILSYHKLQLTEHEKAEVIDLARQQDVEELVSLIEKVTPRPQLPQGQEQPTPPQIAGLTREQQTRNDELMGIYRAPKPVIICKEPECEHSSVGFPSEQALQDHVWEEHTKPREDPKRFVRENLALALGLEPDDSMIRKQ
ncbi:hypothetical protein FDECE_9284 [Fusarium decemcellulare]|nr:hypothetical protein FDECE_9284 [Fusarium decemcellulare]